jgi:hypothetical protein
LPETPAASGGRPQAFAPPEVAVKSLIHHWPEGLFVLLFMLPLASGVALGDWRACLGGIAGLLGWAGLVWLRAAIHDRGSGWREAATP